MVADYFTKPLQGALFYKFRDQIMGLVPMETIVGDHRSVLDKESRCLGVSEKPTNSSRAINAHKKRKATEDVRTTVSHPSWSDIVKTQPQTRRKVTFHPIKQ
jgi:hypothetical protein